MTSQAHGLAADLCQFVQASPTPFHAVSESIRRLELQGFSELVERETWDVQPGGAYYISRGQGSLVAFIAGQQAPDKSGFLMVGSHTDSPNLRLKTESAYEAHGYGQLGVEIYGGVLLYTWVDRDLGLAGRVAIRDDNEPNGYRMEMLRIDRPIARVPALAIHLDREIRTKGLKLNPQKHMPPIFAVLNEGEGAKDALSGLIQGALGSRGGEILGHDLSLFDVVPPTLGGHRGELVFSPRLDNLGSAHASLEALLMAPREANETRMIMLYDHEEVGSQSARGADSAMLDHILRRLTVCLGDDTKNMFERAIARSYCISADMAHAVHPNFSDRHEPRHMPLIGHGPVVKTNVNQRYATDGESSARFRSICKKMDVPFQEFINRTDLGCGSTIGPITASALGIATVDIGSPMTSMHSIREMAGSDDVPLMIRALAGLFGQEA